MLPVLVNQSLKRYTSVIYIPNLFSSVYQKGSLLFNESFFGRHKLRNSTLILMAYRHGLRVSELVALRWEQIDFTGGTIYINRLKNGVSSTHPLRGVELRALQQLQRDYPESNYLFLSERGTVMAAAQGFRPVRRRRRLEKLCFSRQINYQAGRKDSWIIFKRSSSYATPRLWLLFGESRT